MRAAWLALLLLGCTKSGPQERQQAEPEAAANTAPAQDPPETTNLSGIWEGNLGTQPVRACFVERDDRSFGAYFALARLQTIGLNAVDGAEDAYDEGLGDSAPVWRDVQATATTLTARWTHGRRTLPVQLRRLAGAEAGGEDGPCASVAFHRPRFAGIRTVRTRARADGVAYTKLALDTRGHFDIAIETFALDGDSAAVRRINTALAQGLGGDPPDWFFCISNSLNHMSSEGGSSETSAPVMISRRWLSVANQSSLFCGGAHPSFGDLYLLYDLSSGAEVELLDWFLPTAVKREHVEGAPQDSRTLQPAFRAFLLANWHPARAEDTECRPTLQNEENWNAGLTRRGIVFIPWLAYVHQSCTRKITIPFERIRPWLTPEGATAVAALRAERR